MTELNDLYSLTGVSISGKTSQPVPIPSAETFGIILQSVAALFLLPYPNTPQSEQNWDFRQKMFLELVEKHQSGKWAKIIFGSSILGLSILNLEI